MHIGDSWGFGQPVINSCSGIAREWERDQESMQYERNIMPFVSFIGFVHWCFIYLQSNGSAWFYWSCHSLTFTFDYEIVVIHWARVCERFEPDDYDMAMPFGMHRLAGDKATNALHTVKRRWKPQRQRHSAEPEPQQIPNNCALNYASYVRLFRFLQQINSWNDLFFEMAAIQQCLAIWFVFKTWAALFNDRNWMWIPN